MERGYQFSEDWFQDRQHQWVKWLGSLVGKDGVQYLEVGVFEGRSALWVAENILTGENCKAVLVDPFLIHNGYGYESQFLVNLQQCPQREIFEVRRGKSHQILRDLPMTAFDLIYIDGSHASKDVFIDAANAWLLLKPQGYLIFDDYSWSYGHDFPATLQPRGAIDAFLSIFASELELLEKGKQVFIKKLIPVELLGEDRHFSRVGEYTFFWRSQTLYDRERRPVALTPEAQMRLKAALKGLPLGEPHLSEVAFKGLDLGS